mmetsp:Transcript_25290/g.59192  ORF Transcript_25290/g.59192 Transcript_25290/m.59192 type:complete len:496 (-) Transcript_25290:230-1717(-)|eukprot:CAMPEP_0197175112 /NCGR_PEP_ID=MMETSP1423-20130617/1415_1 /TAXON_ID=476441 /ORGANISM="Pseudo-nitzschia heimii, Strain UNC1101" /LENGTH=495 /DNA_ID=CAMNT_0042624183 /DNA_START=323 /DNA_END=1810 /DNA_ORIENTATION=+
MSNLPYASTGTKEKGEALDNYPEPTRNDWMSDEERKEAFGDTTKMQLKLDPFQICLFPTYLSLPEAILQEDLRENLQVLVTSKLRNEYGKDFEYFALTEAKIDWYSGEESSVCGSLENLLPSADELSSSTREATILKESSPCTCALYSGATVMLKSDGNGVSDFDSVTTQTTPEILEPQISAALMKDLVTSLRDLPSPDGGANRPIYTELKGTSISWTVAQRKQGGKLVINPNPESEGEQLMTVVPSPDVPGTPILDESMEDSTKIDVANFNALEGSSTPSQSASGFNTKGGKVLASVVGALLLITLVMLFAHLHRKKRKREVISDDVKNNDINTVISEDAVDEEIARSDGWRRRNSSGRDSLSSSSVEEADNDDMSEAAQYRRGNIMDSISVASDWTYTTGVTGVSSGVRSSGNKTAAEMQAAKETFDRDRQITLQKDMLQSEWSGAVASPSSLHLTRSGNRSKPKVFTNDPNTLQFEEATGQGEEIFLMKPSR